MFAANVVHIVLCATNRSFCRTSAPLKHKNNSINNSIKFLLDSFNFYTKHKLISKLQNYMYVTTIKCHFNNVITPFICNDIIIIHSLHFCPVFFHLLYRSPHILQQQFTEKLLQTNRNQSMNLML